MKHCYCYAMIGFISMLAAMAPARTMYVSPAGTNNAAGYFPDWAGAATNIQDAITKAVYGNQDVILVTNATYVLTNSINWSNLDIILRSWNNGNLDRTGTIINANGVARGIHFQNGLVAGFTFTNGTGTGTGVGAAAGYGGGVSIGFSITHGGTLSNCVVAGNRASRYGGGIYAYGSNVLVVDCDIIGNSQTQTASSAGGGVYAVGAQLKNCMIAGNTSKSTSAGGGGVHFSDVKCRMTGCTVSNNTADAGGGVYALAALGLSLISNTIVDNVATSTAKGGGGIYLFNLLGSSPAWQLTGGAVSRNQTPKDGGGIFAGSSHDGMISNVVVSDNTAGGLGGGIYVSSNYSNEFKVVNSFFYGNQGYSGGGAACSCALVLENCVISNNYAATSDGGGARLIYYLGIPGLRNCLIVRNTCVGKGGGVYITGTTTVENCTIALNTASNNAIAGGGLYFNTGTNILVLNTICYSNLTPNTSDSGTNLARSSAAVGYLFSYGCTTPTNDLPGSNNVASAPLFAGQNNGDYRLTPGSPCVDAGLNQPWMAGAMDLDGRLRLDRLARRVDMGCYEFVHQGVMFRLR